MIYRYGSSNLKPIRSLATTLGENFKSKTPGCDAMKTNILNVRINKSATQKKADRTPLTVSGRIWTA